MGVAGISRPNRRCTRRCGIDTTSLVLACNSGLGLSFLPDTRAPTNQRCEPHCSPPEDAREVPGVISTAPKQGALKRNVVETTNQNRYKILRKFMLWGLMPNHISDLGPACRPTKSAEDLGIDWQDSFGPGDTGRQSPSAPQVLET